MWWQQHIGRSLAYGEFGENLTTEGIEVNDALIGKRWEIGTTVLERDDISSSDDEWSHVLVTILLKPSSTIQNSPDFVKYRRFPKTDRFGTKLAPST